MKKNLNIFATLLLITGLMAPTGAQATGFLDNFLAWFSTAAGASAGVEVGRAAGRGVSHHVGEMIPEGAKKPLIVAGIVGVVAYIIYTHRDQSSRQTENNRRPRSCANKGCSHKKCK